MLFGVFFGIFCYILYIQKRYRWGAGTIRIVIENNTWEGESLAGNFVLKSSFDVLSEITLRNPIFGIFFEIIFLKSLHTLVFSQIKNQTFVFDVSKTSYANFECNPPSSFVGRVF